MRNQRACIPEITPTCPGSRVRQLYSPVVCSDGRIVLEPSGTEDIQALIESYLPTTDMAYIMNRLRAGDTSVLNPRAPMFGDFTAAPRTPAEAMQLVIDAERDFPLLSAEERAKYNNDYHQYLASKVFVQPVQSVVSDPVSHEPTVSLNSTNDGGVNVEP